MTVKSFIKLFVPPLFIKIVQLVYKVLSKRKTMVSTIVKINKEQDSLIVIGNGPSLKITFEKYRDRITSHDCIVVNHFCETEYYKKLEPKYYLIADPAYFGNIDTYAEWMRRKIQKFIVDKI